MSEASLREIEGRGTERQRGSLIQSAKIIVSNHGLIIDGKERAFFGRKLECVTSHDCFTYTFVPPRELAVRCIYESTQVVSSYTDFELLLEIAFALSNDHGKGQASTICTWVHEPHCLIASLPGAQKNWRGHIHWRPSW